MWTDVTVTSPPLNTPAIGFNPAWVDGDFNPAGIRECFRNACGSEWVSALWVDYQDTYTHSTESPTHWAHYPKPPELPESDDE